jgi:hypothetical protein
LNRADCFRQANGDAQEASHIERLSFAPLKNQIQRLTSRIFEYEDRPRSTLELHLRRISAARSIRRGSLHGFCRISSFSGPISAGNMPPVPCWLLPTRQCPLQSQARAPPRRTLIRGECHCQNRRLVIALPAAVESDACALAQLLQFIFRRIVHAGILVAGVDYPAMPPAIDVAVQVRYKIVRLARAFSYRLTS